MEDLECDDDSKIPELVVPTVANWIGVALDMSEGYPLDSIMDHINDFVVVFRNKLNSELVSKMEEAIREVMSSDGTDQEEI